MKDAYTIVVDDREKNPLLFPNHLVVLDPSYPPPAGRKCTVKLSTVSARLPTGDYILLEHPKEAVVERKGCLDEIANNTLNPKSRANFVKELERLQEFKHKWLMLEGTPAEMMTPTYNVACPGLAVDGLQRLLLEYGVPLLLMPGHTMSHRRAMGEWVARLLINGVQNG